MSLKKAIAEWIKEHPEYSTQAGALYQCDWASGDFVNWLESKYPTLARWHKVRMYSFYISHADAERYGDKPGKFNPDPVLYSKGSNENGNRKADWHCIVETKHFFIDMTARQYTEKAAYPHIISKKELAFGAAAGK